MRGFWGTQSGAKTSCIRDWSCRCLASRSVWSFACKSGVCRSTSRCCEVSELIYETCKTYLIAQGKFLFLLWLFVGVVIVFYFKYLQSFEWSRVSIILLFSIIGILGSYGVAWFGIRVNTFANSRTAFASLSGRAFPCYAIPLKAGISIGMLLISVELLLMLIILMFIPGDYAGPCFIGFAIGESLGAAALRVAGGIFTKIADIGADMMKIVFKIKEDDARNPGVIADCTGDNAGDSVGPSADGFETYGVTGVALITFMLLAVKDPTVQIQLLVWIFMIRVMMVLASVGSYFINDRRAYTRYSHARHFNFESPLTFLVWLTSIVSIILTYAVSSALIPTLGGDDFLWWKLSTIVSCGTLAGAIIPEVVKIFTSTESRPRARSGHVVKRGRGVLEYPLGTGGRQLQRLLDRHDHRRADGHRLSDEHDDWRGHHARPGRVCLRPGRLRIPRHGPGDDRRRQLWAGDRQRPVGLRALHHRKPAERAGGNRA